jgi:hypothetical protein
MLSYAGTRLLILAAQQPAVGSAKLWNFAVAGQFDEESHRLGGGPGIEKKLKKKH